MDNLAGTAARWNIAVFKEPRGFIKVIEFFIAIFAFATTTSSHSSASFVIDCKNKTSDEFTFSWGYPFRLENSQFDVILCNGTKQTLNLYGNYGAPSQFYVFVGVMAFLYCIAALILYVCFDDHYRKFDKIPSFDFLATCAFVLMWLISAASWAAGVVSVKKYTDPLELQYTKLTACRADQDGCTVTDSGNYSGLNVSIIFGFLCMLVWGGNLWFLFKETKWHKEPEPQLQSPSSDIPPQRI